jgi:hypothetical protein
MRSEYTEFLKRVASDSGLDMSKTAMMNPLENDMFARLINGAVKGLETVAIASFDFKLVAISKMLRVWYDDKMKELQKNKIQTQYGADAWDESKYQPNDPYSGYSNFY